MKGGAAAQGERELGVERPQPEIRAGSGCARLVGG